MVGELLPKEVFAYFKEISDIPRGSGNTREIADYCELFAKKHGLVSKRDEADNIIIFKAASEGYEDREPVILQGHLDMVCEKDRDCDKDMEKEGVRLCTDGAKVWADGTTLGADDGIAIAYILAVLASDTILHPAIEAVLTNDEEIGMLGARALDVTHLQAKRLINLDSEKEGVIFVSCAGGVRTRCEIPVQFVNIKETLTVPVMYEICISGLLGGHSGIDIHKQNTNAIRLLGDVLSKIQEHCDIRIIDLSGGGKDNTIPKMAKAWVCVGEDSVDTFVDCLKEYEAVWKRNLENTESQVRIDLFEQDTLTEQCLTEESTRKAIFALQMSPDGVYKMSPDIPGMVQTSLNIGTVCMKDNKLIYKCFIRSNTATGKTLLLEKVKAFVSFLSGTVMTMSDYPAWEYNKNSKLREVMIESFRNVYGYQPEVTSIHAGLECGILSGKMSDVDMISFGPTLMNVHTPEEYMDVASVQRTWKYLVEVLKNLS